jgi:peptidoglycan/xylan/chitin deacetylase (PgdA/CDA1 family)
MNIPVLMYHRVCPNTEWRESDWSVTAGTFEKHLRFLKEHGYSAATLDDLLDQPFDHMLVSSSRKPVVITLDDGYLDNYTTAFPLLQKYGFTATLFVVTDFLRRANWWDGEDSMGKAPLMEPKHMREMMAYGMQFGSHTVSHPKLCELDDKSVERELKESRLTLEDVLSAPVKHFAYPYGSVDERVKRIVARTGYKSACAVNSGPLHFDEDPYEIRRVLVSNRANEPYLYTKLLGFEKLVRWFYWLWKAA